MRINTVITKGNMYRPFTQFGEFLRGHLFVHIIRDRFP